MQNISCERKYAYPNKPHLTKANNTDGQTINLGTNLITRPLLKMNVG